MVAKHILKNIFYGLQICRNLKPLAGISKCLDNYRIYSSRKRPDISNIPELNEPPFKEYYQLYYQEEKGRVYDKLPFKVKCQAGKLYYWCPCGHSHDQPFCDGKCILPEMKIKLRPIVFKPKETREYWFCNCKQTKNRPFCDGSHNTEEVQAGRSVIRH